MNSTYAYLNRLIMAQSYKSLKESFVSNLSGGTILEINTVTAVAPVSADILFQDSSLLMNLLLGCCPPLVSSSVAS